MGEESQTQNHSKDFKFITKLTHPNNLKRFPVVGKKSQLVYEYT